MNHKTTPQDILNDIEFEIAQGMLSKEAFGPALEAVRQFQNRLRSQTFRSVKLNDPYRQVISRQFQTIDMLLALLQEMALRIQALQAALDRLAPGKPAPADGHTDEVYPPDGVYPPTRPAASAAHAAPAHPPAAGHPPTAASFARQDAFDHQGLLYAMRPENIHVPLQARSIRFPLIGGLLTRLRIFYQRPALHYTALLSERQAPVNRLLGEQIMYLQAQLQAQQEQIDALCAQSQAMRAQVESLSTSPADTNHPDEKSPS